MTLKIIYISTIEVAMLFNTIESLQIFIFKTFFKYDSVTDEKVEIKKSLYDFPIKFNEKIIQYILDKNTMVIICGALISMILMLLPVINIVYTFEIIKSIQLRYSKIRKQ